MPTNTIGEPTTLTVDLPSLGEAVTEATVIRWLKRPGEAVAEGEPLVEVATDKVDTEIAAPAAGVVTELLVDEDSVVDVGAPLALLSCEPPESPPVQPDAPTAPDRVEKLPAIRRTIARRMMESLHNSAQLTTVIEVDLTDIGYLRARRKDDFHHRFGIKLSLLPFVARATVAALADHPVINSSLDPDCVEVTLHRAVHLGIAVDTPRGLMVPVIRDADKLDIPALARSIADVAERARTSSITPDELTGGTFTITNTGSRGALFDTPIINQPQSAILGVGAAVERLVPARGIGDALQISARSMAFLALSYDHRIVDGADAARYLGAVRERLESGFTEHDLV